jgi:two-component system sensor histidine kinase DesK
VIAVTVGVIGVVGFSTTFGLGNYPSTGPGVLAVPLDAAAIAIQLRHSLAAAAGVRPRGAMWTLLALAILVYLPLPWLGWEWAFLQFALAASVAMLLPRRPAVAAIAAILIGTAAASVAALAGQPAGSVVYQVCYRTLSILLGWVALYGSVRLVRLLDEVRAARTELAELAIGRERLRVSRDLHDLLGQSLSAVSLKGDLAIRLLDSDPRAARIEIASLTHVARDALRGVRALSRDEHAVSLRGEAEGATALLASAGIEARVDIDLAGLRSDQERMLAWSVREGVTNVLRHSQARSCTIAAGRRDGRVCLEIVNDGASGPMGHGTGLTGLVERARALSGVAFAGHTDDDRFRLHVEVPEVVA